MSLNYARLCPGNSWRTRIVTRVSAVALPLFVLAACGDESTSITAPPSTPELRKYEPGGRPPNAAAGLVFCDVAIRSPAGKYRVKNVPVKLARDLFDASGATVKFGYTGWVEGASDPSHFALCQIPATPSAEEFFRKGFNAKRSSAVQPKGGTLAAEKASAAPSLMVAGEDGTLMYQGEAMCDPYAIVDYGCECTNSCDGWDDGGGDEIGPQPTDPDLTDDGLTGWPDGSMEYYMDDAGQVSLATTIICSGRTDYVHRSSHVFGMANVIGSTTCTSPVSQSLTVTLSKQSCWWVFCWWSGRGYGFDGGFKALARTNAAAPCSTGWWRGRSNHSVTFPFGYWPPWANWSTQSTNHLWC